MDDYTRMWVEHHTAGKDYMRTGFPTNNHHQVLLKHPKKLNKNIKT